MLPSTNRFSKIYWLFHCTPTRLLYDCTKTKIAQIPTCQAFSLLKTWICSCFINADKVQIILLNTNDNILTHAHKLQVWYRLDIWDIKHICVRSTTWPVLNIVHQVPTLLGLPLRRKPSVGTHSVTIYAYWSSSILDSSPLPFHFACYMTQFWKDTLPAHRYSRRTLNKKKKGSNIYS